MFVPPAGAKQAAEKPVGIEGDGLQPVRQGCNGNGLQPLAKAVAQSGVARLLVVGGAGVLLVAPGVTLLESGKLPPEWVPIASSHAKALAALKQTPINLTYLSPAAMFEPGERTGHYRVAQDTLLINEAGESRISMEDYAIAVVDELEQKKYQRTSFAVAW